MRRHNFSIAGQFRPGRCDIAEIYEHSRKDNEKEIQHYLYQECFTIVSVTPWVVHKYCGFSAGLSKSWPNGMGAPHFLVVRIQDYWLHRFDCSHPGVPWVPRGTTGYHGVLGCTTLGNHKLWTALTKLTCWSYRYKLHFTQTKYNFHWIASTVPKAQCIVNTGHQNTKHTTHWPLIAGWGTSAYWLRDPTYHPTTMQTTENNTCQKLKFEDNTKLFQTPMWSVLCWCTIAILYPTTCLLYSAKPCLAIAWLCHSLACLRDPTSLPCHSHFKETLPDGWFNNGNEGGPDDDAIFIHVYFGFCGYSPQIQKVTFRLDFHAQD